MSEATAEAPAEPEVEAEEAEAEEAPSPTDLGDGWLLVHEAPEERIVLSETQGRAQVVPANYRAEKYFDGTKIEVQADSMELLEERIESIEDAHSGAPEITPQALTDTEGLGGEETTDQAETVITAEGRYLESDWVARSRSDTIVTEEGQTIYSGGAEEIEESLQAIAEDSADAEHEAHASEPVETEQIVYDTANAVDAPGQSAGGTLVVPEGVEDLEQVSEQMAATTAEAENRKAADEHEAQLEAKAAADEAAEAAAEGPGATAEAMATEAAIATAEAKGIDLSTIEGSGKDGRITKADVDSAASDS